MEKLKLIEPTLSDKSRVLDYKNECLSNGETVIHGDGGLDETPSYEDWLIKLEKGKNIQMDRIDLVPATTYIAVRDADDKVIGTIQIRHKLNDSLLKHGGHIGYEVRPSERQKGYATLMLGMALEKCRELGINKVLVTCNKANIASAKTILHYNGILENEIIQDDNKTLQRYWIDNI